MGNGSTKYPKYWYLFELDECVSFTHIMQGRFTGIRAFVIPYKITSLALVASQIPVKQPWRIWTSKSCGVTTIKLSTTQLWIMYGQTVKIMKWGYNWGSSWWRHQMETFSVLLTICAGNSPVIGEFPVQRPVTRSFDVFFDLRLNKRLSKQWWGWWFETPSHPLWRHCNVLDLCLTEDHWHAVKTNCNSMTIKPSYDKLMV